MPYSRKSQPKKKTAPRRKAPSFAAKVKAVVKQQSETKYKITSQTENGTSYGNTVTSPANWANLNDIAEGSSENQRVGNRISPTFLNVRGSLQSNTLKPVISKLLILETNRSNDPTLDLLEDNAGSINPATRDLYAISARINTTKYKVLKTITFKTGTYANHVGDFGGTHLFNCNIKLSGVMHYDDGVSVCQKRNIILVPIYREAQNDAGLGETMELTFNSKFYYKDL
ncbi:MAG: hypothetical protein [Cressdnaviricota sp.]|nr:MAG: hypothetical protein [Cressdnaviricota sp.]